MAPPKQSKVAAERRARVEAMRKEQQAKENRVKLIIGLVGGLVAIAIVAVIVVQAMKNHSAKGQEVLPAPVSDTSAVTVQPTPSSVPDSSGITGVKAYVTATASPGALAHDHVDGPVTYAVTPPVGGPHNAQWANCGVYDSPIPNERAVHDLEHGAIWITYRKNTSAAVISQLQALVARQKTATFNGSAAGLAVLSAAVQENIKDGMTVLAPGKYMDLTPWTDNSLPSPIEVTAWGRQLGVDSPTDPRIQKFIDTFRANGDLTYEAGIASCNGTDVNIGGKPIAS